MTIYDNLTLMLKSTHDFEILEHINVDDMDDLVRKNLVIIISDQKGSDNILMNQLIEYIKNAQFDVEVLKNVDELFHLMKKNISRIGYVLFTYNPLCRAWMSKKTPFDIYMIFRSLKDFGVHVYPNNKLSYFIGSRVYFKMFNDHYPEFSMPHSKVIFYPSWSPAFYEEYEKNILQYLDELKQDECKVAVFRKSFTEGKIGKRFMKLDSTEEDKKEIIKSMEHGIVDDKIVDIGKFDKHSFKSTLIQYYCKMKPGTIYSMWYINGKFTDVYYTNDNKLVNHYNNQFLNKLKDYGYKFIKTFMKDFAKNIPEIFRLDIGVLLNNAMMDKHFTKIDSNKMRLYVHKIETEMGKILNILEEKDEYNEFIDRFGSKICKVILLDLYKRTENSKIPDIIKKL